MEAKQNCDDIISETYSSFSTYNLVLIFFSLMGKLELVVFGLSFDLGQVYF